MVYLFTLSFNVDVVHWWPPGSS